MASQQSAIHFLQTTIPLVEKYGVNGTSVSDVLKACNAQKGSLYHFFPGGKDELIAKAIDWHCQNLANATLSILRKKNKAADGVYELLTSTADLAEKNNFQIGAPFAAIAQEAANSNETIRQSCADAYQKLIDAFTVYFQETGMKPSEARSNAIHVLSAFEGAIVLSRVFKKTYPLRTIASELRSSLAKCASKESR